MYTGAVVYENLQKLGDYVTESKRDYIVVKGIHWIRTYKY